MASSILVITLLGSLNSLSSAISPQPQRVVDLGANPFITHDTISANFDPTFSLTQVTSKPSASPVAATVTTFPNVIGPDTSKSPAAATVTSFPNVIGPDTSKSPAASTVTSFPNVIGPDTSKAPAASTVTSFPNVIGPDTSKAPAASTVTSFPNVIGPIISGAPTEDDPGNSSAPASSPVVVNPAISLKPSSSVISNPAISVAPASSPVISNPAISAKPIISNPATSVAPASSPVISNPAISAKPIISNPAISVAPASSPVISNPAISTKPIISNPAISVAPALSPIISNPAISKAPSMPAMSMNPAISMSPAMNMMPSMPTMSMTPAMSMSPAMNMMPSSPVVSNPAVSTKPASSPVAAPTTAQATSTSPSAETKKDCFAGSETVRLESGEDRQISQIMVGDRVLAADAAGRMSFSEVVFVPHKANRDTALFVHITTASGRDIKMTKSHVLPAGACGTSSSLPLKYASQVTVNDCVTTVSGEESVSSVGTTMAEGLQTLVTKEEFVIVNGIISSPFAYNHIAGNMYYHIHRFLYEASPQLLLSPLLRAFNEALGALPVIVGYKA